MEKILKQGVEPDAYRDTGYLGASGSTILMRSSCKGFANIVDLLLKAGAEVEAKDNCGRTALIEASRWGHVKCVEKLIAAGANVDAQDIDADFPLILAAYLGHGDIFGLLLEAGAQPDLTRRCIGSKNNPRAAHMDGKSALIVACEYSRLEIVQMLLGAGASKNLQDHAGKSPLDYASMTRNNAKIIDLLTS